MYLATTHQPRALDVKISTFGEDWLVASDLFKNSSSSGKTILTVSNANVENDLLDLDLAHRIVLPSRHLLLTHFPFYSIPTTYHTCPHYSINTLAYIAYRTCPLRSAVRILN